MSRSSLQGTVEQNLIDDFLPPIEWQKVQEAALSEDNLHWLLGAENSLRFCKLGISASFSQTGGVPALALAHASRIIAQPSRVLIILPFSPRPEKDKPRDLTGRQLLESRILASPDTMLFAFDLADLVLLLHHHLAVHVSNAIDIQSALPIGGSRSKAASVKFMLGDTAMFHPKITMSTFSDLMYENTSKSTTSLVLRAWLSAHAPTTETTNLESIWTSAHKVDTSKLNDNQLYVLAKLAHDQFRQDSQKSATTQNTTSSTSWDRNKAQLHASSDRYQTRLVKDDNLSVTVNSPLGPYRTTAQVTSVAGSSAVLSTSDNLAGKIIASIQSTSNRGPTQAEKARHDTVLGVLQGRIPLWDNPWLQSIWLTSSEIKWPDGLEAKPQSPVPLTTDINPNYPLNPSQRKAVEHMVSTAANSRITLIQGPPGTGKTSVIATYVLNSIKAGRRGIWLIAQSNVAVKNIAEKLASIGFTKFRILVSAEFHYDWHEHLYREIERNIIRSDNFPKTADGLHRTLDNTQVMLCTLSMLSNRGARIAGFFRAVPLINLVIDEASQIEVGGYVAVFSNHKTIQKVCFIGDYKQLPPHGTEEIEVLQSIFEMKHLRASALFLDTQYRMPPQIGDFISKEVYDSQLLSNPEHKVTSAITAIHFIDVGNGTETHSGTSWVNHEEVAAVLHVARFLNTEGCSFRIITPYDPQRTLIENGLKESEDGLPWEDKVFNVDAFQGNEEDFIIISIVRTRNLGFLSSLRRVNVMLTRCKRGMYICSNRAFLEGKGSTSLVGAMAKEFGSKSWVTTEDLIGGNLGSELIK